jgi:hypothetical protein
LCVTSSCFGDVYYLSQLVVVDGTAQAFSGDNVDCVVVSLCSSSSFRSG